MAPATRPTVERSATVRTRAVRPGAVVLRFTSMTTVPSGPRARHHGSRRTGRPGYGPGTRAAAPADATDAPQPAASPSRTHGRCARPGPGPRTALDPVAPRGTNPAQHAGPSPPRPAAGSAYAARAGKCRAGRRGNAALASPNAAEDRRH